MLPGGHFHLRAEQATLLPDLGELIRRAVPDTIVHPRRPAAGTAAIAVWDRPAGD